MKNLVDVVKQMSIGSDLNMDGLGSQADVSNPFDTGVRSNQLDDQDENVKVENIRGSRSENAINQGPDEAYVEKRKHKPTPRWLQYQSDQLQERRTMLNRRITRKSSAVDSLLYSSRNVEAVTEQMLQIDDMFKKMMEVHKEYNSMSLLEVQEDDEKWFDDTDADMLVFKQKIHNWIKEAEQERDAEMKEKASVKSNKPHKSLSRSSRSSRSLSTKSSRSDRALKEKLKMAELQAAAEFMEKQQTAEFKMQKLKIEEQYAKSQARMTILEDCNAEVAYAEANPHHTYRNQGVQYQLPAGYDKFTSQIGVLHFNKDQRKMQAKKLESILCDQMSGDTFVKNEHYRESKLVDATSDMLSKLLRLQPAPDVDIETFDGNVLNYHYFMALLREVVESKVDDPRGKLIRLIKYTSGDARELIKHCIQLPSNEGYKDAIYLLDKIYGDSHKILASYRNEVKNWQRFHNFLLRCKSVECVKYS